MATSSPPVGFSNHRPITHGVGSATSPITSAVPNNSFPITDDDRAAASNSLLRLIPDAPTSTKPMATPRSVAGSCVQLHTPNNASRPSLDTFHFFPKLAPELRLKIWSDALPDARIVEVEVCTGESGDESDQACKWWASAESKQTPCDLLLASKESRYVYLKHWLPIFRYVPTDVKLSEWEEDRYQMVDIDISDSRYPLCYFNPKVDMLYLGPYNPYPTDSDRYFTHDRSPFTPLILKSLAAIPALRRLRRLGCQFGEWEEATNHYPTSLAMFHLEVNENFLLFPALEEFTIGVGDIGWEAMNFRGQTKPNGEIELMEILPEEWRLTDDEDYPRNFDWWWDLMNKLNSVDWQAPSLSVKRVLRRGKPPQYSLTGWDELACEKQRQIDELLLQTQIISAEGDEEDEEEVELINEKVEETDDKEIVDENSDMVVEFNGSVDEGLEE